MSGHPSSPRRSGCHYVVGARRSGRGGADGSEVAKPAIGDGAILEVASMVEGGEYQAGMVVPPDFVRHFYRRGGPMQIFIGRVCEMCSAVQMRIQYGHRARQTVAMLQAVGSLGYYFEHTRHFVTTGPETRLDRQFIDWMDSLRRQLQQSAQHFVDPFPRVERERHQRVERATNELHDALFGPLAGQLRGELGELLRAALRDPNRHRDVAWGMAVLRRVSEVAALGIAQLEQGYRQNDMARALEHALAESPGAPSSLVGQIASALDTIGKGGSFVSHAAAAVAKNDLVRGMRNPARCGATASALLDRLSRSWSPEIRAEVRRALESGEDARIDAATRMLERDDVTFEPAELSGMLDALGVVQALFVLGSTREQNATELERISDALSRGEAIATLDQATVKLIGFAGRHLNATGLASCCRVLAAGLEHAGNALSVASAAVSIVQGFNTFSDGFSRRDDYLVASGSLQMASGVLIIVGVCCEVPVLQGAALLIGLMLVIGDYERERSRRVGYSHGLLLRILDELDREDSDARRHCEQLGVLSHVHQLRLMVSPDWLLQESSQGTASQPPRADRPRWEWFGPHADQLRLAPGGHQAHSWTLFLRNAGFTSAQVRQIFSGPATSPSR